MQTYVKLLLTMMFWGGTFVAGRSLAGVVSPVDAAFLRFAVASAVLLALLIRFEGGLARPGRAQIVSLVLLGLTGVLGYNLAFFKGLETVTASRAGLIIALNPVGIALMSSLIGDEPLRPLRVTGIVLSVCGAAVVISRGRLALLAGDVGTGELILLICVLCWALYSVVGRRTMRGLSPLAAVTYSALAGTVLLAPLFLARGALSRIVTFGPAAWAGILYLSLFGTVVGFLWYYQAIREIGAVRAGVFINFVPLFAMLFGVLFLGEALTSALMLGGLLVLSGAWITNYERLRRQSAVEKDEP